MLNVDFLPNGLKGASLIQHSTFNIQHYSFNIQHYSFKTSARTGIWSRWCAIKRRPVCGMETACHRKNCRRRRRRCRCSPARNCRLRRPGRAAVWRRERKGDRTPYGFLSPLDSPYLPLRCDSLRSRSETGATGARFRASGRLWDGCNALNFPCVIRRA